jgi:hypothetical protein
MSQVTVTDWKPINHPTLRGFATVTFPSGLVFNDISIVVSDGKPWAPPPSKPLIDKAGVALRDGNGKIRYAPIVAFADKKIRERWSQAVLTALTAAHPDALGDGQ